MNRKYLVIFLMFCIHITSFTHAATAPSGGGRWTNKTVTRVGLDDIIEATARQQTIRNGSSVTLEAVVRETVNRRAVGKVLLSRLLAGGVLVGATQSLLDGIGWVMEEGTYVKYKEIDNAADKQKAWAATDSKNVKFFFGSPSSACEFRARALNYIYVSTDSPSGDWATCRMKTTQNVNATTQVHYEINPYYNKEAQRQKFTLTDDLMGDIAVGDYTDPVDKSKDKKDRIWTGVEESYQNDPTGTGNELSNNLDDKMDAAPEKPSKPSTPPNTDGEGQKYPTDKGTDGKTDQEKDPTTGEPTGKGSFTLPEWCLWAADQCQWHKEDKQHQTEEKTVWEDEKKHRSDEKTFWQKLTDFFDFAKEERQKDNAHRTEEKTVWEDEKKHLADEKTFWQTIKDFFTKEEHPDDQDTEVEITDDQLPDLDKNLFQASGQCPPDFTYDFPLPLGGTYKISYSYETACFWFSKLYYIIVTVGFAIGLKIITGVESRQDG